MTQDDFFEDVLSLIGGGVVVADQHFKIIYANPEVHNMLGYDPGELEGISVNQIIAPESLDETQQLMVSMKKDSSHAPTMERAYLKKNGEVFYAICKVALKKNREGKECFYAVLNDFNAQYTKRVSNKAEYQSIVENADDIIFTVDVNGNFLYANKAAERVTGLTQGQLLKANYLQLISAGHKDRIGEIYHQHFMSRQNMIKLVIPIDDGKGSVVWLDQKLTTVWDKNRNQIKGYSAVSRDVTSEVVAKEKLQESQSMFASIFQNVPIPIVLSDPLTAKIIDFNDETAKITGYDREELLKLNLADIDKHHSAEHITGALQRVYKEDVVEGNTKWLSKKGRTIDVSLKNSKVTIGGKELVLSACIDFTKLNRLNSENQRFRVVMENAPFGIYITDAQSGELLDVNNTVVKQLGYEKNELLKLNPEDIEEIDLIKDPDQQKEHFKEIVENELTKRVEGFHRRKDGSIFPVVVTVSGKKIEEDSYVIASVFDNTEAKHAENQLKEQNEVLKIIQALQSEFIAGEDFNKQFVGFLDSVISHTKSSFGFIGEIMQDKKSGAPYLKTHAITDISWDKETEELYQKMQLKGFEFRNLDTLFGQTISSGELYIANDPANDPKRGGTPHGHPELKSYIGIPIKVGDKLIGMVGLANKEGGYSEEMIEGLKYFISTYSVMIQALRTQRERERIQNDLERLNLNLSDEVNYRKKIQEQLFHSEENERKRVARDLHDGLGQTLTAAKLAIGALRYGNMLEGIQKEIVEESAKLIERGMAEVRAISHNLMPVVLTDYGLIEALDRVCDEIRDPERLEVNFSSKGSVSNKITDGQKVALYRIAQEAINNAIKYSKTNRIDVTAEGAEQFFTMQIKDYGIGFDTEQNTSGIGISNIKYRSEMLGANLEIKSIPNKGTTLDLILYF